MGNTVCCTANTQPKPQFGEISIQPSATATIQNYLNSHLTIKEVLQYNAHGEQKILRNKNVLLRNSKQHILENDVFIGQLSEERKRKGYGVMLADAQYYQGEWLNGMKNGSGILVNNDGSYYYGQWKNDVAEGRGRHYDKSSKTLYEGEWKAGFKNGKGIQKYEDGSVYDGDFVMGVKSGKGKLIYGNGTEYEGQFRDNVIEGIGTFKGKNHSYDGQWKSGKMHGAGKSEWRNDKNQIIAKYIGQYKNGIKQGFGEYTDSKGVTYKAIWTDGQINQKGPIVTENLRSSIVEQYNRQNHI